MKILNLKNEGRFFSGRSHAVDILSKICINSIDDYLIIDFQGVESFSQSFISELLFLITKDGFLVEKIKGVNFKEDKLEKRFINEVKRYKKKRFKRCMLNLNGLYYQDALLKRFFKSSL